jgi:hypothetical protein
MKTLIYTIAYGDECWECARLMVLSLRSFGQYTGEVIVYADRDGPMEGATVMRDTVPTVFPWPHMAKAMFGRSIPTDYDRILFFDADLVILNPVQPLIEYPGDICLPIEMSEGAVIWKDWFSLPCFPVREGDWGLNSGTISCKGSLWQEVCHQWWDSMIQHKTWTLPAGFDQPCINHLIRQGRWNFIPFPREWFFFLTNENGPIHRKTIIFHPKNHKIPTMRSVLNMRTLWT